MINRQWRRLDRMSLAPTDEPVASAGVNWHHYLAASNERIVKRAAQTLNDSR